MTTPSQQAHQNRRWKAYAAAFKLKSSRDNAECAWCHNPIDYTLHPSHKWAFTADHIHELQHGGHLLGELAPLHRYCNSIKGNGGKPIDARPTKGASPW